MGVEGAQSKTETKYNQPVKNAFLVFNRQIIR